MSLVERALKKLQETRTPSDALQPPAPREATESRSQLPSASGNPPPAREIEHAPVVAPTRVVQIDKQALREMELMPPTSIERQISSEYQHVKRALVKSALGRSGSGIANGHLIMIASALPGEGKTFTSINLALSLAREKDTEVLLVDADVAKPHVSRIFKVQSEPGLLDLLSDSSRHPDSCILSTDVPGLKLLPAGRQLESATELIASDRMAELVQQLGRPAARRIVLFDSPPLLLSTESRALAPRIGQVVLVVRAEFTPQRAVFEAIEAIGDAVPVSLILNQSESTSAGEYYGYGTYGDPASEPASGSS